MLGDQGDRMLTPGIANGDLGCNDPANSDEKRPEERRRVPNLSVLFDDLLVQGTQDRRGGGTDYEVDPKTVSHTEIQHEKGTPIKWSPKNPANQVAGGVPEEDQSRSRLGIQNAHRGSPNLDLG